ncbi:MAG TPA: amino acid-binding protein, partial [Candidatus Omnitrophota bacterium]|nr:amino acid-binding protein [Candidatus Omnitrophota bacterium]
GGLAKVLGALSKDKIDVEYMYAFVEKQSGKALMVFRFENIDKAVRSLAKNKFVIVGKKEIQSL